jgi:uracil-DNA glycosylase
MKRWTPEWKKEQLSQLYIDWQDCRSCDLGDTRLNIVFGNGYEDADIMMVGEGPGEHEDESGNAFVGKSGLLLSDIIQAAGLNRDELFITNMVMCRPPGNRVPTKGEMEACYARLRRQIYVIDPLLIICVGAPAMKTLMKGEWKQITKQHGHLGEIKVPGERIELKYSAMPILHPAFILREDKINEKTGNWEVNGWAYKTKEDLESARRIVEKLKERYKSVQNSMEQTRTSRLRVIS